MSAEPSCRHDGEHWRVALAERERRRRRKDRERAALKVARDYGLSARHATKAARVTARTKAPGRSR